MSRTSLKRRAYALFEEHRAGLVAIAIAIAMFILYRLRRKLGLNEALFANFFTDACGIAVTVVFIERLVSAPDRKAKRIGRELASREAKQIYMIACDILRYPLIFTANLPPETSLVSGEAIGALSRISLQAEARTAPPTTWEAYFESQGRRLREAASLFLGRYVTVADPELLEAVLEIEKCGFLTVLCSLSDIRRATQHGGGPHSSIQLIGPGQDMTIWYPVEALRAAICRVGRDPDAAPSLTMVPREARAL